MKEPVVKIVLVVTALLSLGLGGVFMIIPGWFVTLSEAESVNVAWLRNVGAGLVALQGFGLFAVAFRRRETNPLLGFIALTSSLQSVALWYSLIVSEFSAQALWAVVVPSIVSTGMSVLLWGAWISRRRSAALIARASSGAVAGGAQGGGEQPETLEAVDPGLPPDLPDDLPPDPPSPREQQ